MIWNLPFDLRKSGAVDPRARVRQSRPRRSVSFGFSSKAGALRHGAPGCGSLISYWSEHPEGDDLAGRAARRDVPEAPYEFGVVAGNLHL